MSSITVETDTWLQHLPFVGGQRPSPYGMVDGIWYGLIAGDGDATGDQVQLNGNLSFDRKEDWIYVLGGVGASVNAEFTADVFIQVNSGPLIPTSAVATTVRNPSFTIGGSQDPMGTLALSVVQPLTGGADPRAGMPIFGDKRIPGLFLMMNASWSVNTNLASYQLSSWGWLIEYQSFFRNRPPALG